MDIRIKIALFDEKILRDILSAVCCSGNKLSIYPHAGIVNASCLNLVFIIKL
jgi:hypothetical protein